MTTAAVAIQSGPLAIEMGEMEVPASLPDDQALVRVEGSGICGSDYEQFMGHFDDIELGGSGATGSTRLMNYPVIPGHEPVGVIEWIGRAAARRWGVEEGDRVAIESHVPCGVCRFCGRGQFTLCQGKLMYGYVPTSYGAGLWGGFSEYMTLTGNTFLHKLPHELSIADAVLFNPLGAGFEWAVKAPELRVGEDVLVIGPGQRGLAAVVAAREAGANRIVVIGLAKDTAKLELAAECGATQTIVHEGQGDRELLDMVDGGEVDVVLDVATGAPGPVATSLTLARVGGRISLAGVKGMKEVRGFVSDTVVFKALTLIGTMGVANDSYAKAVATICSGKYDFTRWHTRIAPLTEVESAIRMFGEAAPIHVTVVP